MILKIPLPWLQLTYKKMRFFVALMGIGFAVMLMFLQLGLRDALFQPLGLFSIWGQSSDLPLAQSLSTKSFMRMSQTTFQNTPH